MSYTTIATSIIALLVMTLVVKNIMLFSLNNQSKTQKLLVLLSDFSAFITALYFYLLISKRIFSAPFMLYFGGFSFVLYSLFPFLYLLYTTKPAKKKLYTLLGTAVFVVTAIANLFLNEFDFIKRIDLVYLSIPSIKSVTLLFLQVAFTALVSLLGLKIIEETQLKAKQIFSSTQKFQFSWLCIHFRALIGFSVVTTLAFTVGSEYLFTSEYSKQLTLIGFIYLVVLITTIDCIKQAPITDEDIEVFSDFEGEFLEPQTIPKQLDDLDQCEEIVDSVIAKVKEDNLYLDSDLKLSSLSSKCGIPSYQISRSINFVLNKNFNEFINDFRIIEAKKKLTSEEFENVTILAIALESGFNSKSSFNAQFKKRENTTPNEYRSTYSSK